ncbi:MAG: ATP-binding cassette domain-containing protein [Spirochaetaceae bacterium]|nr:MAG: ATP-binding cassette domain-containing protein [Spirochaetaceae bacterium]
MIEITDIHKRYGSVEAVRGVSFAVGPGEIVGLLGPNGAGKTTILKILTGYHYPDAGSARIAGENVTERPRHVKSHLGYLPENAPLYGELTVAEYLRFLAEARGVPREAITARCSDAAVACGVTEVLHRRIATLSKGYRQRTGLAQAMLHDPDILILDEPTSGLDPNQIVEMRRLIRSLGQEKTVILSSHILQEVEAVCDRVLILHQGRIAAAGTAEQISVEVAGGGRWRITLIVPGSTEETVPTLFSSLPGCTAVEEVRREPLGGRTRVSAEVALGDSGGQDPGEVIFDWACHQGYKLVEAAPVQRRLEELFTRLTGEAP